MQSGPLQHGPPSAGNGGTAAQGFRGTIAPVQPEPVTVTAPRAVGVPLLRQGWRDVAFLHWPLDPAVAAPLLPPGCRPDVHDGATYVGLVCLRAVGTGVFGSPGVPYLGSFAEFNVRLYSVDERGRRGVVFRSMDADRLVPVLTARAGLGLPYAWSRTRVRRDRDRVVYRCRRRLPSAPASAEVVLRPGHEHDPEARERFLTARWGLHHRVAGRTVYLPVEHPPWRLHRAHLDRLDTDLPAAAGLPGVGGPPVSVLYSPGLDARLGPPVAG